MQNTHQPPHDKFIDEKIFDTKTKSLIYENTSMTQPASITLYLEKYLVIWQNNINFLLT